MVEDGPTTALLMLLEGALSSANKFAGLAKDSEETGIVPCKSDPAIGTLLDRVFDTSSLGPAASYRIEDVAVLNAWSATVASVANTYVRAGTIKKSSSDDRVRMVDQNVIRFATEIGRCLDALLRLRTLTVEIIAGILVNEPNEDRHNRLILDTGWIGTQYELGKIMRTTFRLVIIDNLPAGWVRDRIAVLAEVAPRAMHHLEDSDADFVRVFAKGAISRLQDATDKDALAAIDAFH